MPRREGKCIDPGCVCHNRQGRKTCCDRCFRSKGLLTTVQPKVAVTPDQMAALVAQTREEHGDLLQAYHQLWYTRNFTWPYTAFLGISLMKAPNDLWVYQDIMAHLRPTTVIETGTYSGGSALWFAFLMDALGIDGTVLTIDIDNHRDQPFTHPKIQFLRGSSIDPAMVRTVARRRKAGPLLVSLDSDHSAAHVLGELRAYAPMTAVGDWVVVEDTNIGWEGPGGDRGARGGIIDYVAEHPGEFVQDILAERYLLTMHPGGWLRRVAPHTKDTSHG